MKISEREPQSFQEIALELLRAQSGGCHRRVRDRRAADDHIKPSAVGGNQPSRLFVKKRLRMPPSSLGKSIA